MYRLAIFIFGFCIGSFLNVLIYRLPKGMSVISGRSFCPRCGKIISWFDNIPLLSFVLLKGKCRFCKKKISPRYPLVELLTGILFVLWASRLGNLGNLSILGKLVLDLVLISSLIVIFFTDLENQIIPDQLIFLPTSLFFLFHFIANYKLLIADYFPSAVLSCGFFYFLHLVTRGRGMGLGDVKLAFLIGLIFGFPKTVIVFYLAFLTGAIAGLILILIKKLKFGQQISFGPFLTGATMLTMFLGDRIQCFLKNFF